MRVLAGAALLILCSSCGAHRTTFSSNNNAYWADRCFRLTDWVHAPLDDNGFRFAQIYWPAPRKDTFRLYAAMQVEPNDDHAFTFYDGDDKVGGAAQITHYVSMPEVAELFADCLDWSGRFGKKSRVATVDSDGDPEEFSAIYVERSTGRNVALETMNRTVGLLVSDRLEGEALRAQLRDRMKSLFEETSRK